MYGKHFASMYTGSMVGAGFGPYAVMGFVVSHQVPNRPDGFFSVDLNVKLLAATFGETEAVVQAAIDYLCAPDPHSTSPGEEGRRLVRIGPFTYRVVNGAHYQALRNDEERREQNRRAQEKHRKKKKSKPGPGETAGTACLANGDEKGAANIQAELEAEREQANS